MSVKELKNKAKKIFFTDFENLVDSEIAQNPDKINEILVNKLDLAREFSRGNAYSKAHFNLIGKHFESISQETKMSVIKRMHCFKVGPVLCTPSFGEWLIQNLVNNNQCCATCQFWALCLFGTDNATRHPIGCYITTKKLIDSGFNVEVVGQTLLQIGVDASDMLQAVAVELAEKPQRDAAMGFVDALRGFENLGNLPPEDTPKVMKEIEKTINEIDEIASQKRTMTDILTKKARVKEQ